MLRVRTHRDADFERVGERVGEGKGGVVWGHYLIFFSFVKRFTKATL